MEMDYKAFGKRLRYVRLSKDMTQEDLSERSGLSKQYISNIENASTKLSLNSVIKIADALETSVDMLLADSLRHVKAVHSTELAELIEGMTDQEIKVVVEIVRAVLPPLRKFCENQND